jgi:hypothetical protein
MQRDAITMRVREFFRLFESTDNIRVLMLQIFERRQ